MINLGNENITRIYLGNSKVRLIYLGDILVFDARPVVENFYKPTNDIVTLSTVTDEFTKPAETVSRGTVTDEFTKPAETVKLSMELETSKFVSTVEPSIPIEVVLPTPVSTVEPSIPIEVVLPTPVERVNDINTVKDVVSSVESINAINSVKETVSVPTETVIVELLSE